MNPQSPTDAKTRRRYAPRMAPEKRREQLIDAALSVIVEQGYEGVSIESIARMAGVTRPVIYDHFANLAALLQALIEREEAYALAQLDDVVPSTPQTAGDPPAMAAAFKLAVEAGRQAFLAGLPAAGSTADASSPLTGFLAGRP